LPCRSCSTLWRDPETRGAVPRAGLRRHAFAVRLAGLLLSCNKIRRPKKAAQKSRAQARRRRKKKPMTSAPQAEEKIESCD
jgi:hypothetical protein